MVCPKGREAEGIALMGELDFDRVCATICWNAESQRKRFSHALRFPSAAIFVHGFWRFLGRNSIYIVRASSARLYGRGVDVAAV